SGSSIRPGHVSFVSDTPDTSALSVVVSLQVSVAAG
ncbi:MAG: hypothetical protein ACI9OJ_001449, partial [Myxococcota bacterium]